MRLGIARIVGANVNVGYPGAECIHRSESYYSVGCRIIANEECPKLSKTSNFQRRTLLKMIKIPDSPIRGLGNVHAIWLTKGL